MLDSPFDYPLMQIQEGATRLVVPRSGHEKGPKAKEGVPFYNPAMRTARDVSVLVLQNVVGQRTAPVRVCDAMAATGARGLRFANEVAGVHVTLNDANPSSIELARHNAKTLGVPNVDFHVGRLEPHLANATYDWVDLDPFGTPAPFIDPAMLSVREGGVLAVTATDRASLSGAYPEACQRRYNAKPLKGSCMPELCARILVGAIVRAGGRRDRGVVPLLAYTSEHYVRVYARIEGGAGAADAAARQLGFASFSADGSRTLDPQPRPGARWAGPLWAGPLMDPALVTALFEGASKIEHVAKTTLSLVQRLKDEVGAPPLYYTVDDMTRGLAHDAPRMETLVAALRAEGHVATRTHFSPRGIKTTASLVQMRTHLSPQRVAAGTPSR